MKKILILLAIVCTNTAYGQLSYGVLGGVNASQIRILSLPANMNASEVDLTASAGWHAGVFGRLQMLLVYIQPELMYTNIDHHMTYIDGNNELISSDVLIRRVDLPIQVGIIFGTGTLFVAPVWSAPIHSLQDVALVRPNQGTWAGQVGIGFKLSKLQLDLRYESSLTPFADELNLPGNITVPMDSRMGQLLFTAGVALN